MEVSTKSRNPLTQFQIQMLELVSHVQSEQEMNDIRRILAQYFAKKAENEIDKLWDEGIINDKVIEGWKVEHMRTPYRQ